MTASPLVNLKRQSVAQINTNSNEYYKCIVNNIKNLLCNSKFISIWSCIILFLPPLMTKSCFKIIVSMLLLCSFFMYIGTYKITKMVISEIKDIHYYYPLLHHYSLTIIIITYYIWIKKNMVLENVILNKTVPILVIYNISRFQRNLTSCNKSKSVNKFGRLAVNMNKHHSRSEPETKFQ